MTKNAPAEYRCLIGFDHVPSKGDALRFEPGDTVTGIPAKVQHALAEARVIEAAEAVAEKAKRPAKAAA